MPAATLAAAHSHAIEVRKSRFLAHAAPVTDPAGVESMLASWRQPDASHLCWAWRIGDQYRSSDAGEPAGTAGRPILAAIDGQDLDQVLVAVLRWFGGIKLGAGGLVRAYGGAAAECLRQAPRTPLIAWAEANVHCGFGHVATIHRLLAAHGAQVLDERFDADGACLRLRLPQAGMQDARVAVRDATRGQARWLAAHEPPKPARDPL